MSDAHATIEELLGHCWAMQCFLHSMPRLWQVRHELRVDIWNSGLGGRQETNLARTSEADGKGEIVPVLN
jgi:hypothetical protein